MKNNNFFVSDISNGISKNSSIGKISEKQTKETDIMNTSAPVRISDYITNKLVKCSSITPKYKKMHSESLKNKQQITRENKEPNSENEIDKLTSAVRIAKKIQEYNKSSTMKKGKKKIKLIKCIDFTKEFTTNYISKKSKLESTSSATAKKLSSQANFK